MIQAQNPTDQQLLEWHLEMGADEAVGDTTINWFEHVVEPPRTQIAPHQFKKARLEKPDIASSPNPKPVVNTTSAARPVTSSTDSASDARKLALSCKTVEELTQTLSTFDACPLSRTATNLCFIDGNIKASTLLIGEAPGRDEDLQGKPFVGRSGQLLDKMLKFIDLSRTSDDPKRSVLISNTVFWRPPGNRKPTEAEMLMCMPFVTRLIEMVQPKLIVCLGATPTQRLTGQTRGITRLRGRWFEFESRENTIPLLATLHPSYLLRQPIQKSLAWRDFISLKQHLDEL